MIVRPKCASVITRRDYGGASWFCVCWGATPTDSERFVIGAAYRNGRAQLTTGDGTTITANSPRGYRCESDGVIGAVFGGQR